MLNHLSFLATSILLSIFLIGEYLDFPIRSLIPYAIAVGLITWTSGVTIGIIFSGIAILIALKIDAFPASIEANGLTIYEYMYAYMKLSSVVFGVWLGSYERRIKLK